MKYHEKLDYVEFPAQDLSATKQFFARAFGWSFEDFGTEYCAFSNEGLDGGFYQASLSSSPSTGGALLVFYSEDLASTQAKVVAAGGRITKDIFSFPGGRRFHFLEPSGNEFAVWSSNED
ncbi:MAG: VOC family protein [Gammaproteobacteria bacterium]|nr:VOC family protein [Gammaproteobacteria bacterium]